MRGFVLALDLEQQKGVVMKPQAVLETPFHNTVVAQGSSGRTMSHFNNYVSNVFDSYC